MGLIRDVRSWFGRLKGGPAGWTGTSWSAGPLFVDWNRTRRAPAPPELVEAFKQIVFACATLNANGVARTPLRLYASTRAGQHRPKALTRRLETRRERSLRSAPHLHRFTKAADAIDEVLEHPLLEAVNRVNPDWDHNALLRHAVFSLDVIGRAYWWMEPGRGGTVANVWPLLAQYVLPLRDPVSSLVSGYRYFDQEYAPDALVRMRQSSLRDPYALGLAPAEAAFAYVGLADQFVSLQENLLTQGARPSLLVSNKDPAEPMGKEERARFQRDINASFTRGGAGMAWVVDGALDVKTLTFPPADLAALQISENAVQRIANCFGVPLSLLKTEDVNLANAEAGHRQHAELAIDPRCNLIASALTQWTRTEGQRLERSLKARGSALSLGWDRLFWAFDNPVKEDQERNARVHDLYVKDGVLTINDVRAELGYDPVDWGDEPWLPSSLAQPSSAPAAEPDEEPGKNPDPAADEEPDPKAGTTPDRDDEADDDEDEPAPGRRQGKALEQAEAAVPSPAALLRHVLRRRGWAAAYEAGTLTARQRIRLLRDLRDLGRRWLRREALRARAEAGDPGAGAKSLTGRAAAAVRGFADRARRFLGNLFVAGALALGGPGPLGDPERRALERAHQEQVAYLDQFEREVASTSIDTLAADRAEQYGASVWGAAQAAQRAAQRVAGQTHERRVHRAWDGPCPGCAEEVARGWQPIGTLAAIGTQYCRQHCHCVLEYTADPDSATDPFPPGDVRNLGLWFRPAAAARRRYRTLVVDLQALDRAWSRDGSNYLPPGASVDPVRREAVERFLTAARRDRTPVDQSLVVVDPDGSVSLEDGRHRLAVLRDLGVRYLPVSVDRAGYTVARRLYGYDDGDPGAGGTD